MLCVNCSQLKTLSLIVLVDLKINFIPQYILLGILRDGSYDFHGVPNRHQVNNF